MKKPIDIMDIKKAIKSGDIKVYATKDGIFVRDINTGESAKIGEIKDGQNA